MGRLRKDAALRGLPPTLKKGQRRGRGRPPKYGKNRISLAKRAGQTRGWLSVECTANGKASTKTYKTFLATYVPAGGVIRVVLVKEEHGWYAFYCTDATASVQEIVEAFADRATIEQALYHVNSARREGSVGFGATTGTQYLDQLGCLQFESLDAYISGTMGVETQRKSIGKPRRLTVGRSPQASFPRKSSKSPAGADHAR